jgi:hypothetical protein
MKHQHDRAHHNALAKESQNLTPNDNTPKQLDDDLKLQWSLTLGKSNSMAKTNIADKMSYEDLKISTKF